MAAELPGFRLEQYSLRHSQEVLMVTATVGGELEQVLVFKGFSSCLTGATAFDPDIPLLPEGAEIHRIDRLQGPYQPDRPQYLEKNITWPDFETRLAAMGL